MSPAINQLDDQQLAYFDVEYVTPEQWAAIRENIDRDFPDGRFSFIDVGGGNGVFCDRLLDAYPAATGAVLDSSQLLLARNKRRPRKTVIQKDVGDLGSHTGRYDLVCMNWLLHHLVTTGRYTATRENMGRALQRARGLLTSRGRISVMEHYYNGFIDGAPGRLIFWLTSSRLLTPLTKRLGANTAGVGVCFLSRREWLDASRQLGLTVHGERAFAPNGFSPLYRTLLIREIRQGHLWLS